MSQISQINILIVFAILSTSLDSGEGNLFAISGKGDRDCLKEWHGSYEEMDDEKQCKEFAETYGHSFKTETDSGYPRGCYLNNKNAYFNKHSQGSAELNSQPICRKRIPNEETERLLETKIDELMDENKNLSQQLHRIQNLSSIREVEVRNIQMTQAENLEKLGRLDIIEQKLDHLQETMDDLKIKDVYDSKKIGYVCVDKKIWCKTADCTLENVTKNCPKTCNKC